MKKIILLIIGIVSMLTLACHHRKVTKMSISENSNHLKIEYSGDVVFNDANTAIVYISPGGYFKCRNNNDDLLAKSSVESQIEYELNGALASAQLNTPGRILLKDAVKAIVNQRKERQ